MAEDMMDLVSERASAGVPDQEIVDELLGSYTGAVLLDPPASGATLVLWLAPLAVLGLGIAVILWWRRHPPSANAEEPATPGETGPDWWSVAWSWPWPSQGSSWSPPTHYRIGRPRPPGWQPSTSRTCPMSNETMEAVIAANADDPQVNGMRLALAERYFDAGDYRSAFPHYLVVAEDPNASGDEAITALVRLGWMAYAGNGEVETATRLIDEALAIDPESSVARYVRARVVWCGTGETEQAIETFGDLLADPALATETRAQIESDLELARDGGECP